MKEYLCSEGKLMLLVGLGISPFLLSVLVSFLRLVMVVVVVQLKECQ